MQCSLSDLSGVCNRNNIGVLYDDVLYKEHGELANVKKNNWRNILISKLIELEQGKESYSHDLVLLLGERRSFSKGLTKYY